MIFFFIHRKEDGFKGKKILKLDVLMPPHQHHSASGNYLKSCWAAKKLLLLVPDIVSECVFLVVLGVRDDQLSSAIYFT